MRINMTWRGVGLCLMLGSALVHAEERVHQQIQLISIGTSTFYVESHIQGSGEAPLLVDTGSGYSTINEATLAELKSTGDATYLRELEGVMANGSSMVVPVYRISRLVLADKCAIRDVEVAVFPSGTRQILGLSALKKVTPFTFSLDPPSLTVSNCEAVSAGLDRGHMTRLPGNPG